MCTNMPGSVYLFHLEEAKEDKKETKQRIQGGAADTGGKGLCKSLEGSHTYFYDSGKS